MFTEEDVQKILSTLRIHELPALDLMMNCYEQGVNLDHFLYAIEKLKDAGIVTYRFRGDVRMHVYKLNVSSES